MKHVTPPNYSLYHLQRSTQRSCNSPQIPSSRFSISTIFRWLGSHSSNSAGCRHPVITNRQNTRIKANFSLMLLKTSRLAIMEPFYWMNNEKLFSTLFISNSIIHILFRVLIFCSLRINQTPCSISQHEKIFQTIKIGITSYALWAFHHLYP